MRRLRSWPWLLIPILAGGFAYFHRTGDFQREWSAIAGTDPVYDAPAEVTTDVVEVGDIAIARFRITNRGGGVLVVNGIRSSCACSGLERSLGDRYEVIEELKLGPGEVEQAVVRVAIHQVSVKPQRVVVYFRTSDPTRPEAAVAVVIPPVPRGTTVAPAGVAFGAVLPGATVREELLVLHAEQHQVSVKHVASSDPRVVVRMLPNPRLTDPHGRGVSVAAIEVVVNTDVPAVIDATVSILADGVSRPLPPVPVSGRIMAPVEVSPRSLMLPIASSGGPIKEATCLFRSSNGKSFDLRLESAPPGFDVEIQPLTAEAKSIRVVRIRLKEHASKREGGSRVVIRFRTSQNSADSRIELPVMVNGGDK